MGIFETIGLYALYLVGIIILLAIAIISVIVLIDIIEASIKKIKELLRNDRKWWITNILDFNMIIGLISCMGIVGFYFYKLWIGDIALETILIQSDEFKQYTLEMIGMFACLTVYMIISTVICNKIKTHFKIPRSSIYLTYQ